MKQFFNVLVKVIAILLVIILVFVVLVVSSNSQKIPDVVVSSSGTNTTINALRGNYSWNSFSGVLNRDDYSKGDYIYKNENTLLVAPSEKISIYNNKDSGIRHNFEEIEFTVEDVNGEAQNVQSTIDSDSYKSYSTIIFDSPQNEGTYLYFIKLGYFEKGEVEYSFKVVVSSEPTYSILDLVKYKGSSFKNVNTIKDVVSKLPYSNGIDNYIVRENEDCNSLVISYSELIASRTNYTNNAIALLALFPDLDVVEFASSDNYYRFSRDELETLQGRNLTEYADNPELWEVETFYKEKREDYENTKYEVFIKIVEDAINYSSGDMLDFIVVDTKSFNDKYDLSNVNSLMFLNKLKNYAKIIYDISLEEYRELNLNAIYIGANLNSSSIYNNGEDISDIDIVSGDINTSGDNALSDQTIIDIIYIKNKTEEHKQYYANYYNNSWEVYLHN